LKKCVVCKTTIEKGDYCEAHAIAEKNLRAKYSNWQKAYGEFTWKEYLMRMTADPDIPIGDWAKEVADYLLSQEEKSK
jgi:hypothetical protein